ncbi:hypothetical protein [Streptomyces sp. T028]|uniref:hypothetical protein n=1 Tax=Streptomyces sp. T028 TaxID=3394379 RepID=UPI003A884018
MVVLTIGGGGAVGPDRPARLEEEPVAKKDITWDDLNGAEKRAVLRADARGAWQILRGAGGTPRADRRVEAIYDKARKRIANGQ